MFENTEFNNMSNVDFNSNVSGNDNFTYNEVDVNMTNNYDAEMPNGFGPSASMEPIQERVVHRTFVHEVPHVCPIRTRIINHHIYKHTYRPEYSCCEENEVCNVECGSCCDFQSNQCM
ncbi:MAG: hypothetical protein IJH18_04505 [Bacilli bacterium]|nr:hypothetical protein [Bacilli bacterium]